MTKLKIDLHGGVLEVEGEEKFVEKIYEDFKQRLENSKAITTQPKNDNKRGQEESTDIDLAKKRKKPAAISLAQDDELMKTLEQEPKLSSFFEEKSPTSAFEKNAVFVYYLKEKKKIPLININHIFTCYKSLGTPYSKAFEQSLRDTASKKRWLNTSNMENIQLTTGGSRLVDHELPRKNANN